jgi:hypothetical protein
MKRRSATKTRKMRGAGSLFSLRPGGRGARVVPYTPPEEPEGDFPLPPPGAFKRAAEEEAPPHSPDRYNIITRLFNEQFNDLNIRILMLLNIYDENNRTSLLKYRKYYEQKGINTPVSSRNLEATESIDDYPQDTTARLKKGIVERLLRDITLICWMYIYIFPDINAMLEVTRPDIYNTGLNLLRETDEILGSCITGLEALGRVRDFEQYYPRFLEKYSKIYFDSAFVASRQGNSIQIPRRRENMDLRKLLPILKMRRARLQGKLREATDAQEPLENRVAKFLEEDNS